MKYIALATDYDGTIAHDGIVDDATVDALGRARAAGLRLLLVTGRELPSLFNTFARTDIFDRVIAENGAVLYDPERKSTETLSSPPPPALLERLQRANVPLTVGHSIVATVTPYQDLVLDAIRQLGIEWHVIFNKGAVMALPSTITKATGLSAAFRALELSPERVVGVGDAENDHAFLQACGLSVAVANAVPAIKERVHLITRAARGAGVQELIEALLAGDLASIEAASGFGAGRE